MSTMLTNNESKREQTGIAADAEHTREGMTFVPRFDIWETADELVLYGDMPGVKSEDLDIQFENNQLVIHGRTFARYEGRKVLHAEYGIGDFHRSFAIGETIDASKIFAELSGGVLTLHLPKSEKVKLRKIEVKGQ